MPLSRIEGADSTVRVLQQQASEAPTPDDPASSKRASSSTPLMPPLHLSSLLLILWMKCEAYTLFSTHHFNCARSMAFLCMEH